MKLRPFELTMVVIFGILGLLALFLLSTYSPAPSDNGDPLANVGVVSIWGTLPDAGINKLLQELAGSNDAYRKVSYKYINGEDFDRELLSALADGTGPDLMLVSQERLVEMRKRIQPISYESFPIRDIRNLYVDGAQIFALSDGLYGYPVAVDPLMMYWNRDILATKGYLEAPKTWEALVNTMFPNLIERDFNRTIRRSVVAMGEVGNVRNAFGTISALLIQSGSQLVTEDDKGRYAVRLQSPLSGEEDPLRVAADFYARFGNSSNALYSWNRAFGEDLSQFTKEDLTFYFGYGSEGPTIERINPNLNFDIAEIPQGASATVRRTYGQFYALSLLRSSDNPAGAVAMLQSLGSPAIADKIAIASYMAPAYRVSVSGGSNDTYGRLTYQSASIALSWLNPDFENTTEIFTKMVTDINENRRGLSESVNDVSFRLKDEF